MANDTPTIVQLLTPLGAKNFNGASDAGGNIVLQSTPRVGGALVDGNNPMPVADSATSAHFGADGTGISQPTGGSGVRGWLSGLYQSALTMVTSLASIVANTGTVAGAVSGGHVQATIATPLPAGINAIGSVATTIPGLTYGSTVTGTVGTGSSTLVAAGTFARTLLISTLPTSTTNVWLNPSGGAAAVGSGLMVAAGGGSVVFGTQAQPMPTGNITAITDGGSSQPVALCGG